MRIFKKLLLLSILIIPTVRGEGPTDQVIISDNKIIEEDLEKGLDIQKGGTVTVCEDITVTNNGETAIKDGLYKEEFDDRYRYRYLGKDIEVQTGGNLIGKGTITGPVIRHHDGKAPEWEGDSEWLTYDISLANITNHGNISADLTLTDASDKFFEVINAGQEDPLARMYRDVYYSSHYYNQDEDETKTKITTIDGEPPIINLCDITKNTNVKTSLKNSLVPFDISVKDSEQGSEQGEDGDTTPTTYTAYGTQEGQDIGQITLQYQSWLRFVYPFSTFRINIENDSVTGDNNELVEIANLRKEVDQYNQDLTPLNNLKETLDKGDTPTDEELYSRLNSELNDIPNEIENLQARYSSETNDEEKAKIETEIYTLTIKQGKYNEYSDSYCSNDGWSDDDRTDIINCIDKEKLASQISELENSISETETQIAEIEAKCTYKPSDEQITLDGFKAKENSYEAKIEQITEIAGVTEVDGQLVVPDGTTLGYEKITEVLNIEIASYDMMIEDGEKLNEYYTELTEKNTELETLYNKAETDNDDDLMEEYQKQLGLVTAQINYLETKFSGETDTLAAMYKYYQSNLEIKLADEWDQKTISKILNTQRDTLNSVNGTLTENEILTKFNIATDEREAEEYNIQDMITSLNEEIANVNDNTTWTTTQIQEELQKKITDLEAIANYIDSIGDQNIKESLSAELSNRIIDLKGQHVTTNTSWEEEVIYANISDYTTHLEYEKSIYTNLINKMSQIISNDSMEAIIEGVLQNNTDDSAIATLQIITGPTKILYLNGGIDFSEKNAALVIGEDEMSFETKSDSTGGTLSSNGNVVIGENATFRVTNVDLYPSLKATYAGEVIEQTVSIPTATNEESGTIAVYTAETEEDQETEGDNSDAPGETVPTEELVGSRLVFHEGDEIETNGNWTFYGKSKLISKRQIIVSPGTRMTFGAPYPAKEETPHASIE